MHVGSKVRHVRSELSHASTSLARALYTRMLRTAATIAGIGLRTSPPRAKVQNVAATFSSSGLFRHRPANRVEPDAETPADFDTVADEISRWETMDRAVIDEFADEDGLVNEFALLQKQRHAFPLHHTVFRQVSSHLAHEANTEQLFSLAGGLSDDNGKMDPYRLAVWVSVASNRKAFMPSTKAILERYMLKFSKGGTVDLAADAGLGINTEAE